MTLVCLPPIIPCHHDPPPPEPPRLPHGTWLGFNDRWTDITRHLGAAKKLGAETNRFPINWAAVERRRDHYRWGTYDRTYKEMVSRGVEPILSPGAAPKWARHKDACGRKGSCVAPPLPKYDGEWAEFIRDLAHRYSKAIAIEPWNEPNLKQFWAGGSVNPHRYSRLLNVAYEAAKQGAPRMAVISAGLSIGGHNEGEWTHYLKVLYRNGLAKHSDGIAIHPYPRHAPWAANALADVEQLANIRDHFGDEDKGIWVTEVGITTTGPAGRRATPEEQGEGLVEIFKRLEHRGDVPAVIIHRLHDGGSADSSDHWAGMGVTGKDWNPKPSYCALNLALGGTYAGICGNGAHALHRSAVSNGP